MSVVCDIKVSVLVTFYNTVNYVDQCLESILSQKCDFKYEIIAGDDGSDDGTVEKIKEWQDKYPGKIFLHVMERKPGCQDPGPVRASRIRLELLKYVRGTYFTFIDGDDYNTDDRKLSILADILDKDLKLSACGHRMRLVNEMNGNERFIPESTDAFDRNIKQYWKFDYLHTDSLMFRSTLIDNLDRKILRDEFNDNRITYALLQNGKIRYHPETMAVYRWTGNGIYSKEGKELNILREMMSFETEMKINRHLKFESCIRHCYDFRYFYKYHFENKPGEPYKLPRQWRKIIKDNGFSFTERCVGIIEGRRPFLKLIVYFWIGIIGFHVFKQK